MTKTKKIILVLSLITLAGLVLAFTSNTRSEYKEFTRLTLDSNLTRGKPETITGRIEGGTKSFNISFKQSIVIDNHQANIDVYNPNNIPQYIEIYDSNKNRVYKSGKIPSNCTLGIANINGVEAGKYNGQIHFYGLDPMDKIIERAIADINISVI